LFDRIKTWLKRSDASAKSPSDAQVETPSAARVEPSSETTDAQPSPAPKADPASLAHVREWIDIQARSGFADLDTIFEDLQEIVEDEGLNYHSGWRTEMKGALAKQKTREAGFPKVTANDRLTSAFAVMNAQGLIALEDAGYTQSDGWGDLGELYHESGKTAKGGVFYHRQDVEGVLFGVGLNIRFGGFGENDSAVAIGRKAVEILRQHGFDPIWDENPDRTIELPPFEWQRRQTTR